jgi:hypothetical protein
MYDILGTSYAGNMHPKKGVPPYARDEMVIFCYTGYYSWSEGHTLEQMRL